MRRQDLIVLAIAAAIALAGFFLIMNYLQGASKPKRQYVVAAQEIPAGKVITPQDLTLSKPMQDVPVEQYFLQTPDVLGMQLIEPVKAGSLVKRASLKRLPTEVKERLEVEPELPIPSGLTAMTITPLEVESIPSLLKTGQYIDILGNATNAEGRIELQTIIRNAQVLSIQRQTELFQPGAGMKITDMPIKSFSIALDSFGAEVVTRAIRIGKIRIILKTEGGAGEVLKVQTVTNTEVIRGIMKEKVTHNTQLERGVEKVETLLGTNEDE